MKRRSVVLAASLICLAVSAWSCGGGTGSDPPGLDPSTTGNTIYKKEMRAFVQGVSAYARGIKPGFIVIPQNGHELVTTDDLATAADTRDKIILYMEIAKANGVRPLVTDYCL